MKIAVYMVAAVLALSLCRLSAAASPPVPYTSHQFIAGAQDDALVRRQERLAETFPPMPADNPYLEKIEFRAGVDGVVDGPDLEKQTCRLRFYPRAAGETEYSSRLTRTAGESGKMDHDAVLGFALRKRYQLVLDYCRSASLLKYHRSLVMVLQDRETVLRRKTAADMTQDIGALLSARDRLADARLETTSLESRLDSLGQSIHRTAGFTAEIAFDGSPPLITVGRISAVLSSLNLAPDENIDLLRFRQKARMADDEYRLEIAKKNKILEFIEISHAIQDNEKGETSLEAGLELPFMGTGREALWRCRMDALLEQGRYEGEKAALMEKTEALISDVKEMSRQHQCLDQSMDRRPEGENAMGMLERRLRAASDPLNLLKLKESGILRDIKRCELAFDIRSRFIELLDMTGKLTQKPLTDYLAVVPEPF